MLKWHHLGKKSEFQMRFEPMTPRDLAGHSKTLSYGDSMLRKFEIWVFDWLINLSLFIQQDGSPQPREVKHFQFTGWPDHDLPPHPTPFLAFLRRVRFYNPTDAGPIVVHCR